jgi:invasion protein IalB
VFWRIVFTVLTLYATPVAAEVYFIQKQFGNWHYQCPRPPVSFETCSINSAWKSKAGTDWVVIRATLTKEGLRVVFVVPPTAQLREGRLHLQSEEWLKGWLPLEECFPKGCRALWHLDHAQLLKLLSSVWLTVEYRASMDTGTRMLIEIEGFAEAVTAWQMGLPKE